MKSFRIGDLLEVRGPHLDFKDWQTSLVVKRFSEVVLLGAPSMVFDGQADAPEDKPFDTVTVAKTQIVLPKGTREHSSAANGVRVELPVRSSDKDDAAVSFFWPNPLTPSSRGIWFSLIVVNEKNDGYRLRLVPVGNPNVTVPLGYGFFFDAPQPDKREWKPFFLGDTNLPFSKNRYTVAELLDAWKNARPLSLNHRENAVSHCRLLTPQKDKGSVATANLQAAILHADAPGDVDEDTFLLAFALADTRARLAARFTADEISDRGWSVNTRALLMESREPLISAVYRWVGALDLSCMRLPPSQDATIEPDEWLLDWRGVAVNPTVSDKDATTRELLSIRALWRDLFHHYPLGLRGLRARNALSFIPTDLDSRTGAATLRFGVRASGSSWVTRLASIGVLEPTPVKLTLALSPGIDGAATVLEATAASRGFASLANTVERPAQLIDLAFAQLTNPFGRVLIGGLLLDAGGLADDPSDNGEENSQSLQLTLDQSHRGLGQGALSCVMNITLACARPRPVSDDPERGFETDAVWLARERPIVIELGDVSEAKNMRLTVRERASAAQSRVLEVVLRGTTQGKVAYDAVLLDPGPFMAARIRATDETIADPEGIVGIYRDDPDRPAGWEFRTTSGDMTLVLPPQAIGEEMIKGDARLIADPDKGQVIAVPFVNRPFDIRLGPPALLNLDRTDIDTARAPAPWSLRRLLDRREGVVGLRLRRAEFELFYGMTTTIDAADDRKTRLRIAEQQSFVGRIPFPEDLLSAFLDQQSKVSDTARGRYAHAVAKWIRGVLYRPAKLPVFVDALSRDRVTIGGDIRFEPRPSRQTANPFAIEQIQGEAAETVDPADLPDKAPFTRDSRLPLRGGFDYGFESKNIYEAVLDRRRIPRSNQGYVSGLVFGALGGSGSQEALFDEGRTLVITTTTDGRLDALTIVRVGRIGMLWHHARHVIVYERTTRTAPRYQQRSDKEREQPFEFEGLAALRKVREFVEITQKQRCYPDFASTASAAGPLQKVFFESITIPVKSSWGRDIPGGWIIALRGPLAESEKQFYPFPRIFTDCARAASKGGGTVSQPATNPEDLYFYTSTRAGDGGDPDQWPAVPDVDFPVTRRPAPPDLPATPSFTGSVRQPDAQAHDYGQRRFTIQVAPAEEAVDLMHGRDAAGVEARLSNVSLARGRAAEAAPTSLEKKVGEQVARVEARIADGLREIAQQLQRIANSVIEGRVVDVQQFKIEALRLLDQLEADALALKSTLAVKEIADAITGAGGWTAIQGRLTGDAAKGMDAALGGWLERLRGMLDGASQRLKDSTSTKAEVAAIARNAVIAFRAEASERLKNFAFLPERAVERIEAVLGATRGQAVDAVERSRLEFIAAIDALREKTATGTPEALSMELVAAIDRAHAEVGALRVNAARSIKNALGDWFGDVPGGGGVVDLLVVPLTEILGSFEAWLGEVREEIPPIDASTNWEALKAHLSGPFDDLKAEVDRQFTAATDRVAALRQALKPWDDERAKVIEEVDTVCKAQIEALEKVAGDLEQFQLESAKALTALAASWQAQSTNLAASAGKQLDELILKAFKGIVEVENAAKAINEGVEQRIKDLRNELNKVDAVLSTVAAKAAEAAEKAAAALRNVGEQVERAVTEELRELNAGVKQATLEMTRALAEGPITDTLKCTRDKVGYYYELGKQVLDVTRSGAVFNDVGGALNGLAANVPFDRIRERILPQIPNVDLSKLFPDFAGLKLQHLLSGLSIPPDPLAEYSWLKMTHGFDRDRLTAWSNVAIDKEFDGDPELFEVPPISVAVAHPHFRANSRIEASRDGASMQKTSGEISADWVMRLKGDPVLTIEKGRLRFDSSGDFGFDFSARDLRLAPALQFLTDLISTLAPSEGGLTVIPVPPGGVSVALDMPLPDMGSGAFTITGVVLHTHFDLSVVGGFEIRTGVWLSRPDRPFGLAVLFLGGGGWFGVDVRYRPPHEFETHVSIGIAAGAFLALNFAIARGSVGLMLAVGLDFRRNWLSGGSGEVAISLSLLIWGELSVLGIASIYIRVVLRIEYRNGAMTGYGSVSVSIKICWCFTLRATVNMRLPLGSGGGKGQAARASAMALPAAADTIESPTSRAVRAHFRNIDW